jgi:succinyl-CoA synthetase beta subunit
LRLLEWQGREILAREGIPVPEGEVVDDPKEAGRVAERLGRPVVLKAQVPVGGRGKAGGIQLARTPKEAEKIAQALLGSAIKGIPVRKLLVVEAVEVQANIILGSSLIVLFGCRFSCIRPGAGWISKRWRRKALNW